MEQKKIMFSHTWAAHSELAVRTNIVTQILLWVSESLFLKMHSAGRPQVKKVHWHLLSGSDKEEDKVQSCIHGRTSGPRWRATESIACVGRSAAAWDKAIWSWRESCVVSIYCLARQHLHFWKPECSSQVSYSISVKCVSTLMLWWEPLPSRDTFGR